MMSNQSTSTPGAKRSMPRKSPEELKASLQAYGLEVVPQNQMKNFLMLKNKIVRTDEIIQRYKDRVCECESTTKQLREAQAQLATLEVGVRGLKAELQALHEDNDQLDNSLRAARSEVANLSVGRESDELLIEQLKAQIDTLHWAKRKQDCSGKNISGLIEEKEKWKSLFKKLKRQHAVCRKESRWARKYTGSETSSLPPILSPPYPAVFDEGGSSRADLSPLSVCSLPVRLQDPGGLEVMEVRTEVTKKNVNNNLSGFQGTCNVDSNSSSDPEVTVKGGPINHTSGDQDTMSPVSVDIGVKVQTNLVDLQLSREMTLRTRTRHTSYMDPTLSDSENSDSDDQSIAGGDKVQPSNSSTIPDTPAFVSSEVNISTVRLKLVVKDCDEPVNKVCCSVPVDPIVISDMPCLPTTDVVHASISQTYSATESNKKEKVVSVSECGPDLPEDKPSDCSPSVPPTSQSHPLPAPPPSWNRPLPAPPPSQGQPLPVTSPAENHPHPVSKPSLVTELFGDSDSDDCLSVSDDSSACSDGFGDDLADLLTSSSGQELSRERTVALSSSVGEKALENESTSVGNDLSPLIHQNEDNGKRVNPPFQLRQVPPVTFQPSLVPGPAHLEIDRPAQLVTQTSQTGLKAVRPTQVIETNNERTNNERTRNELNNERACQREDLVKTNNQVKQTIKQVSHMDRVDYHTPFLPCVQVETAAADTVSSEDSDSEMDTSFSLNDYIQVPVLSPLPPTPMHMDTHNRSLDTPLSPLPLSPSDQNPLSPLPQSPNNVHHDPTAISPLPLSPGNAHQQSGVVSPLPQSPSERSNVITPLPVSPHQIPISHSSIHQAQFSSSSLPLYFADTAPRGVQVPKPCAVVVKVTDQSTSQCLEEGDGNEPTVNVPSRRKLRLSDSSPFSPPALSDRSLFSPPALGLEVALTNRYREHVSPNRENIDQPSHVAPPISKQPVSEYLEGLQEQCIDLLGSSELPREQDKHRVQANIATETQVSDLHTHCTIREDSSIPHSSNDKLEIVTLCGSANNEVMETAVHRPQLSVMETAPVHQPQLTVMETAVHQPQLTVMETAPVHQPQLTVMETAPVHQPKLTVMETAVHQPQLTVMETAVHQPQLTLIETAPVHQPQLTLMETAPVHQPQLTVMGTAVHQPQLTPCKDVSTSVSKNFIGPILPSGVVLPSTNHLDNVCLEKNGAEPPREVGEITFPQISISNGNKREHAVKAKKKAGKKKMKVSPYVGQQLKKNVLEDTSFDDLLLSFGATGSNTANVVPTPNPMRVEGVFSKAASSVARGQLRSTTSSLSILQEMTASNTASVNSNRQKKNYGPEVDKRSTRHISGLPPKKKARIKSSSQPVATPVHSLPGYEQQTINIGGLSPPGYQLRSRQVDFFETVRRRRTSGSCSDNSESCEKSDNRPQTIQDVCPAENRSQDVCPAENRSQDVCSAENRSQDVCSAESRSQDVCPAENRSQDVCSAENRSQLLQNVCPAIKDVSKVEEIAGIVSGLPSTNTGIEETLLTAESVMSSPRPKPISLNMQTEQSDSTIEDKLHPRPVIKHLLKSSNELSTCMKVNQRASIPSPPGNMAELSEGELEDDGSCSSEGELNICTQPDSLQNVRDHVSSATKEGDSSASVRGISSVKRRRSTRQESVVMTTRKRRHTDGATGQEEDQTPSNSPRQPLTFPSHLFQQQPPIVPDLSRVNCGYGPPKPTISHNSETPSQQKDKALVSEQEILKDDNIFSTPLPLVGGTARSLPTPVSSALSSSSGPSHSLAQQRLSPWMRCPLPLPPWLVTSMANVQSAKSHATIFGLGKSGKKKREKKSIATQPLARQRSQKPHDYILGNLERLVLGQIHLSAVISMFSDLSNVTSMEILLNTIVKFLLDNYLPSIDQVVKLYHNQCDSVRTSPHNCQPLDPSFPPALLKPECQLLALFAHLPRMNASMASFLTELNKALYQIIVRPGVKFHQLAACIRLFTAICRLQGDSERILSMCFELLRKPLLVNELPVVAGVASVWPMSLSRKPGVKVVSNTSIDVKGLEQQTLSYTVEVVVMTMIEGKAPELHKSLSPHMYILCGWVRLSQSAHLDNLTKSLLQILKTSPAVFIDHPVTPPSAWRRPRPSVTAFHIVLSLRLISQYKGWVWTNDTLIRAHLWPLLQAWNSSEGSEVKEAAAVSVVRLIGFVSSHGLALDPLSSSISQLQRVLMALLSKTKTAHTSFSALQLAAVDSLIELCPPAHPRAADVVGVVNMWLRSLCKPAGQYLNKEFSERLLPYCSVRTT